MANKPILKIDIQADEFDSFVAKFHAYQKELDAQPEKWRRVSEEMAKAGLSGRGGGGENLGKMTDALKDSLGLAAGNAALLAGALEKASKAQEHLERNIGKTERRMSNLAQYGRRAAHGAWWGAKHALKIGGILGGVAGGLGIYEMFHLPSYVTRLGMAAGGVGMSPGAYQAFNIGMIGRLQNPAGVQAGLWGLQHNIQALAPIAALMGLNPMQVAKESPEAFHRQAFIRLPDVMKKFPPMIQGQMYQHFGLAATGYSLQDILRAKTYNMTDAERAHYYETHVSARQGALNWGASTTHNWEVLNRTLMTAEFTIKRALINGLAPLSGEFKNLSVVISKNLVAFIQRVLAPANIQSLAAGLSRLSGDVTDLAGGMEHTLKVFGFLSHHRALGDTAAGAAIGGAFGGLPGMAVGAGLGLVQGTVAGPMGRSIAGALTTPPGGYDTLSPNARRTLARHYFLPAIAAIESGGYANPYGAHSKFSSAYGKYQITRATWQRFAAMAGLGANAPKTAANQEAVASYMENYYGKEFGWNQQLMALAWFKGEGVAKEAAYGVRLGMKPGDVNGIGYMTDASGTSVATYLKRFETAALAERPNAQALANHAAATVKLLSEILHYQRIIARQGGNTAGSGGPGSDHNIAAAALVGGYQY